MSYVLRPPPVPPVSARVECIMTSILPDTLDFGPPQPLVASCSARARGMRASEILKIAAEIRSLQAEGRPICNLTVGDFDPRQFPIPEMLRTGVQAALDAHETNYPPGDGLPVLRDAIRAYVRREHGVEYPREAILVTSGSRPVLYAAFRTLVDPGDRVVYPVPSWNNQPYSWLVGAEPVEIPTTRATGFQPTADQVIPCLAGARLLSLCTPANPTGTIIPPDTLEAILRAVVEENQRRLGRGERLLFVLHDQVYGSFVFGQASHMHPLALVPEAAPYVISLDGISKAFAATGLRVGWSMAPPVISARMRDLLAHVGTWAPRPEQVATAAFLADEDAVATFRATTNAGVEARLTALTAGVRALQAEGFPVDCVDPQGAIYLSLRLDLVGRSLGGQVVANNEAIRRLVLERAGWAVVPFQAFGLQEDTGWFRLSVGAVSLADITTAFPRIRAMLQEVG